ncbi:hypothetical protein ACFWRG_09715 [Micromonospora tulbaghiae]|uniref:hypothetical protein n=1 Tax=Micromonospora tulbaghiae TaxID=479978 RepID=UPI0036501913
MTEEERAEWEQRLRSAVDETLRRRAARRQLREQHQAARNHGLRHRHAARLARTRTGAAMTTPQPGQTLTVDVSGLTSGDLASLGSALARLSGWSSHTQPVLDVLVDLASQVGRIRDQRTGRRP